MSQESKPIENVPRRDAVNYSAEKDIERRPPNARKDFRRVLDDERQAENARTEKKPSKKIPGSFLEEVEVEKVSEDIAEADDDSPLSLFRQKSARVNNPKLPLPDDEYGSEMVAQSDTPGSIMNLKQTQQKKIENASRDAKRLAEDARQPFALEAVAEHEGDRLASIDNEKTIKKEKSASRVLKDEDQDAAAVNPYNLKTMTTAAAIGEAKGTVAAQANAQLKELVERIVDKMYTLESAGKTETIIEIKNLGMFDGARVVVSSFTTASKEFNLSFENLTQAAKQLLDSNMNALRTNLEEKGFANAVHIVTTTTQIEHRIPGDTGLARDDERNREDERRERQRRNDEENQA